MSLELWQLWIVLGGAIIGLVIYYVRKSKKLTEKQKQIIEVCLNEAKLWLGFYSDKKFSVQEVIIMLKGIGRIYTAITGKGIMEFLKRLGVEIPVEILNAF